MRFGAILLLVVSPPMFADKIYRCHIFQGGSFWSTDVCSKGSAVTDDAIEVLPGKPTQDQGELADRVYNQRRAEAVKTQNEDGRVHDGSNKPN